jgi:membrane protein DedA with SNARE-associated domain
MLHQLTELIEQLVTSWVGGLEQSGYWGIFVLMMIESSFIPFPSEIVMIPAGALAADGRLNLWGAIAAGTAGSLAGALFNYYFARLLGRSFLLRFGRYFFLPEDRVRLAEQKWAEYGEITTFVCRLLPVIRQLISLPAGLARMNLARFCMWTTLGAGLWVALLTVCGYWLGDTAQRVWLDWKTEITMALLAGGALFAVAWLVARRLRSRGPELGVEPE